MSLPENRTLRQDLFLLACAGLVHLAAGAFVTLFFYGIAVIVFQHAFGVRLPHPF